VAPKMHAAVVEQFGKPLSLLELEIPTPGASQILVKTEACGVCHTDLHAAHGDWPVKPTLPFIPGHEAIGLVTSVGSGVTIVKEGDRVGVPWLYSACGHCEYCLTAWETVCAKAEFGGYTKNGGFAEYLIADPNYVAHVPAGLDPKQAAPLICAGITTYSPMRHWGVTAGKKVGIVGLGGLGHMGVKFAHAMGAHTVVFTTSLSKVKDAKRLGADEVVISKNADEMQKHAGTFDFILDCVSADHDINAYINLLTRDGNMTLVGAPEKPLSLSSFGLIFGRRSVSGSPIGGIAETQAMLDFCGKHNITSDVEVIAIQQINQAYERLVKADVKYRFSIDMASLKAE